ASANTSRRLLRWISTVELSTRAAYGMSQVRGRQNNGQAKSPGVPSQSKRTGTSVYKLWLVRRGSDGAHPTVRPCHCLTTTRLDPPERRGLEPPAEVQRGRLQRIHL